METPEKTAHEGPLVSERALAPLDRKSGKRKAKKDDLLALDHEELVNKFLSLQSELESTQVKLRRSRKTELAAKVKLELKEQECKDLLEERNKSRRACVTSEAAKEALLNVYVHDTIAHLNSQLRLRTQEVEELYRDLKIFKAKKDGEPEKETLDTINKLEKENVTLKSDLKSKSNSDAQISLLRRVNDSLKNSKQEIENELSNRDRKIANLEETIALLQNEGQQGSHRATPVTPASVEDEPMTGSASGEAATQETASTAVVPEVTAEAVVEKASEVSSENSETVDPKTAATTEDKDEAMDTTVTDAEKSAETELVIKTEA